MNNDNEEVRRLIDQKCTRCHRYEFSVRTRLTGLCRSCENVMDDRLEDLAAVADVLIERLEEHLREGGTGWVSSNHRP